MAAIRQVARVPASIDRMPKLVISALRLRPHPTHMHLARALEEVSRIGAKRTLLTHIAHEIAHAEIDPTLPDGVRLAYDGLVVEVP